MEAHNDLRFCVSLARPWQPSLPPVHTVAGYFRPAALAWVHWADLQILGHCAANKAICYPSSLPSMSCQDGRRGLSSVFLYESLASGNLEIPIRPIHTSLFPLHTPLCYSRIPLRTPRPLPGLPALRCIEAASNIQTQAHSLTPAFITLPKRLRSCKLVQPVEL